LIFRKRSSSLLDEFGQAKAEVVANPAVSPIWVSKVKGYPPGILRACQQTIQLAQEKVETWLASYMFRGDSEAGAKAARIAKWLGGPDNHRTHGRPIGLTRAHQAGVRVSALEDDRTLQDLVLSVFHVMAVSFEITPCVKLVENHNGKGWFLNLPQ